MKAELLAWNPDRPGDALTRCRELVLSGGVLVYPTDTFYGLGADPRNAAAVRRLFEIKGRAPDQPILLLIHSPAELHRWVTEVSSEAAGLVERYWPGPLTLVFRARDEVLPLLTAGTGTIGLRVPGNETTRQLLSYLGTALTGTSANLAGRASPRTGQEALAELGDDVDLILDGGKTAGGKPSTIVDVSSPGARIIRDGAVTLKI